MTGRIWDGVRFTDLATFRDRMFANVRSRILAANVEFDEADPTDDIAMLDCQERTDAIMKALFRR